MQSATGDPARPIRTYDEVRELVGLAQAAGAQVISTSTSFRTMQPVEGQPIRFGYIDRTIGAARSAGLQVRLQLVGMPDWALDDPQYARQAPRSEAELQEWGDFVTRVMRHVNGKVDYLEVWNEPNESKWWPTGPDPVEFARLLSVTYAAVHQASPTTQVVSGGLAGNDIGYLDKVYEAFGELGLKASPFDMVGAHPFSGDHAPDSVDPAKRYEREPFGLYDENFTGFMGLHDVMARHGDKALPVYITQFGYSTRAGRGPQGGARRAPGAVPHPGAQADDLRAVRAGLLLVRPAPDPVGPAGVHAAGQAEPAQPVLRRPGRVGPEGRRGGCRRVKPPFGVINPRKDPHSGACAARLGLIELGAFVVGEGSEVPGAASTSAPPALPRVRAQELQVRPCGQRARALSPRHRLRHVHLPEVPRRVVRQVPRRDARDARDARDDRSERAYAA